MQDLHHDTCFVSVEHIMRDVNGGWFYVTCMQMVQVCSLL